MSEISWYRSAKGGGKSISARGSKTSLSAANAGISRQHDAVVILTIRIYQTKLSKNSVACDSGKMAKNSMVKTVSDSSASKATSRKA